MRAFFKFISILFHPLLMSLAFMSIYLMVNKYEFAQADIFKNFIMLLVVTVVFPAIGILMMKPLGFIDSYEMPEKKQRIGPLMVTFICYVWVYLSLKSVQFPVILQAFSLGVVISLALAFVVNNFIKLSLHSMAACGVLLQIALLSWLMPGKFALFLPILIFVLGLVATARMYLKAHTGYEIYLGCIVGIIGQLAGLSVQF